MSSYASYDTLGKDPNAFQPEQMAVLPAIDSVAQRNALIQHNQLVVIDNYTEWCQPCKAIAPKFAAMAKKYIDRYNTPNNRNTVAFAKEDADKQLDGKPRIRGVPCFHLYLNGNFHQEWTITGGDLDTLQTNIEQALQTAAPNNLTTSVYSSSPQT
jgi:thiol-disulfide isomerase/thioredoxin